ncbi:MAG: UvrD-helicase domain-containing protein [Patescibacteria group bacterium]|nr:UvrD-helicase domain-containing protein [Patescibacteria group bacterium]
MSGLNPEQQRAVDTTEGPVLIVAGAGSGKTRVIAHRILNLVKKGISPHSILAITFTNKAAGEMRERVSTLLQEDKAVNLPVSMTEKPFVSTFHALGVYIIRENASILGLTRHFSIYDRADSRRAVKEAMAAAGVDPKKHDPGAIMSRISKAKGDGLTSARYRDAARDFMEESVALIWEKYESILGKDKALDFDDLLVKAEFLLGKPEICKRYNDTWKYIHVDEYQDTNRIQYKIAHALAGPLRNICVVGDADQNIYSWRGATIENILHFEKDYPEAAVITLERNYRSTKTILEAANSVISKNSMRKKKNLYTDNPLGEKIASTASYNEEEEARAIADVARDLIEAGVPAKEIAVLYRANFQSRAIEEAFIKKKIPYQLLGTKFFERREIKDVLSYIRAATAFEPEKGLGQNVWSDISRVINVPARGIGKATVAKILAGQEAGLPAGMRTKLADFTRLLADIKTVLAGKKLSEAMRHVIQTTGIERMLREDGTDGEERLLNVRELVSVAVQYDGMNIEEGLEAFMTNAALASDQDELKEGSDAVRLMTVHASKGLEFDHVFIAGMEQGLFPFEHLDDDEMSQAEEEEERRLFYVALTRARKKVHLSYALTRTVFGSKRVNTPSEFIEDIERHLIEDGVPERPSGVKAIFIDF